MPNHSHFLFVDCQNDEDKLALFQAQFLKHCATPNESRCCEPHSSATQTLFVENEFSMTAITLLVGGDLASLRHACYVLKADMPLMVCEMPLARDESPANAADVFLDAMRKCER